MLFAQLPPRHPHNSFSWIYKQTKVIFGLRLKIDLNSVEKILIVYGKADPFNLKNKQKIHLSGLQSYLSTAHINTCTTLYGFSYKFEIGTLDIVRMPLGVNLSPN